MKKSKGKLSNIFFILILIVGLCIFLYPTVSNFINEKRQSAVIKDYEAALENLTDEDYEAFWEAAIEYNEKLSTGTMNFNLTDEEMEEYESILDPTGTGVIGYLEIESIDVYLPIYHGVDDSVLAIGIGHIPGTSFPTGTESTHTVLSGHRGLPSATLLSDLDQLEEGDTFLLHIMNKTFAYEVDSINIVLPKETQNLTIEEGEDYVTLVTCTPYGINTHRLLVRGTRVDYAETNTTIVTADATKFSTFEVVPYIAGILLAIVFIVFLIRTSKFFKKN